MEHKTTMLRKLFVYLRISLFFGVLLVGGIKTNAAGVGDMQTDSGLVSNLQPTPTPLPAPVLLDAVFDPVPGSRELPRHVSSTRLLAPPSKPNASAMPRIVGQTSRVDLDTLIVVFTNTAMGLLTDADVARLQQEVSRTAVFIWRQSHLKLRLNVTYMVITEYKDISEFTQDPPGSYWLYPDDGDNDGQSVENDIKARGVQRDQYDSINYFWAHSAPYGIPYGGLGGLISWSLGLTGMTAQPIAWWFYVAEGYTAFPHEIQHTIDSMFEVSGYPDYFNPDRPWNLPGAFGEGYDFWVSGIQRWPVENWFVLAAPWGTIVNMPDADDDGIPDTALSEFPTEASLGTSPAKVDSDGDRLEDLDEIMAGIFRGSSPTTLDTDADGRLDGDDLYQLYPTETQIVKRTHALNGNPSGWDILDTQLTEQNAALSVSVAANWDENFLYLMITEDRYAGIHIQIDADNDGWFHGKDNYEILVDPSYPNPNDPSVIGRAHVWDCSDAIISFNVVPMWDDDSDYPGGRLLRENDIGRYARAYGSGFLVQLAIPRNATTGMDLTAGNKIGLLLTFDYLDRNGDTFARLLEREAWIRPILVTARDIMPPNSSVNALPLISPSTFSVNWSGADAETGLMYYDVQYRIGNNGQWLNWLTQTTNTIATFTGQLTNIYYYRTRAWDMAGNVESYPGGNGDTYTTIQFPSFADIPADYWAASWIERLYRAGVTGGCSMTPLMYCPEDSVTRAQMAIFLERGMNGSAFIPPVGTGTVFADVPLSYWAVNWIEKLFADSITTGCGTNPLVYCPDNPVTRSQMAIFLLRAKYGAAYIPPDVGSNTGFNDVPVTYWAAAWIKQLAAEGITTGCGSGNYCPEDPVTRAQMAVFLVRTFNLP